jgi:sulfate transport system ATP-binding protein
MITVTSVSKSYGGFRALDNVSLTIPDGSLTALLGPSGSGKSTLLRVIAGLEDPDAGTVVISGQDVTSVRPQGRGIGFVFQHYAAFKHMTVRDNVAFGLTVRRRNQRRSQQEIDSRVDELLTIVGLAGFQTRYPAQLSGGQRQRMALARALAVDPKVLLLDEPFGALDAKVREELRAWLRRLHENVHVTTVLVTHDQEEAMDVAGHIAVLNAGRIEQFGTPRQVYDAPATEFVLRFLGPVAQLRGGLVRPHDLTLERRHEPGSIQALVTRVTHLGFEVRVELATAEGDMVTAQLTRGEARHLEIREGDDVYVTAPEPVVLPKTAAPTPEPAPA